MTSGGERSEESLPDCSGRDKVLKIYCFIKISLKSNENIVSILGRYLNFTGT